MTPAPVLILGAAVVLAGVAVDVAVIARWLWRGVLYIRGWCWCVMHPDTGEAHEWPSWAGSSPRRPRLVRRG